MPQRMYAFQLNGRSTIGENLPPNLMATQRSNASRIFFLKLKVDFVDPYTRVGHLSSTYVKEMAYPTSQVAGLIRLAKLATTDILENLVGSHVHVLRDLAVQIVDCAIGMVTNPDHAGCTVLPMEINLSCVALTPADLPSGTDEHEPENEESESEKPTEALVMEILADAVMCTVCQEEMEAGSNVARFACRHFFHEKCIKNWLSYNPSCPNCRFQLA